MSNHWTKLSGVQFPRYEEDVLTHKRTLFHIPATAEVTPVVGSMIILLPEDSDPTKTPVIITHLDKVLLENLPDEDLSLLAVGSREDYFKRWEALHMANPLEISQEVWRIQFSYVTWDDKIAMYVKRD